MPWPNLTVEEKAWIKEHGCIHGMYPEESVIFCPNCQTDTTPVFEAIQKRREAIENEKTL